MLTRSITGIIFLFVVISAIVFHQLTFALLFLLIIILGLLEFYTLLEKNGHFPQKWIGIVIGSLTFITLFFNNTAAYGITSLILPIYLPAFFTIFLAELFRNKEQAFSNIALTFLGIFYVSVPLSLWSLVLMKPISGLVSDSLHHWPAHYGYDYNWHYLLGYFFLMWTADTGAYLSGRFLGKHKLFERLSPKKTWEGFIGGIIMSLVVAKLNAIYFTELRLSQWVIVAMLTCVLGTLGDLVESMFKRSIDIKDSGSLLPGHGGILDRFDGVFISSPFVVAYLLLIR
jgi:phosphatidate cytidylyltransferase